MTAHTLFYYPYATMTDAQLPLLKATALYFDKLLVLDPESASWGTIGADAAASEAMIRLEAEGLFEKVAPETVLASYADALLASVAADCRDPEFVEICKRSGKADRWTLALAKVPEKLREEEVMRTLLGDLPRSLGPDLAKQGAHAYSEQAGIAQAYDEIRGQHAYRYADLPLVVGEAIMVNHALLGGLLAHGAIPVTDDPFHQRVLDWKLTKARRASAVEERLTDVATKRRMKEGLLAVQVLSDSDLALPILDPSFSVEAVLEFRADRAAELATARTALGDLARRIVADPWSEKLRDEIESSTIPDLKKTLDACKTARDGWLGSRKAKAFIGAAGLAAGAASAVIALAVAPITPVAVALAALGGVGGGKGLIDVMDDWRAHKNDGNGLSYLVSFHRL